jgi:C_GCAxxG_C_C family probable redox protein
MREAYEWGNEDFLWAGTVFLGGIAGQQKATCGAVSSAAVCLGLRHRVSAADKEKVRQARKAATEDADELVRSFIDKFGELTCLGLLGVELPDEKAVRQAVESGLMDKCDDQIQFIIEKLYELDEKRSVPREP